jgi:ATP-dependent Clp protease, protease subunit
VLVPTVLLPGPNGERAYDLYSRLLSDRIVFLGSAIDETVANLVVGQLLHLDAEDAAKPISLYINSPGGEMTGFFAIVDTMQFLQAPVHTICIGQAASAAAVLLAAGEPGQRYALPNARVLLHQPHGGAQGQSVDIEIQVREMVEMRERMVEVLVEATGQPAERLVADLDRDFILRGQAAVDYGVVDQILTRRELIGARPARPTLSELAPVDTAAAELELAELGRSATDAGGDPGELVAGRP